MKQLEVERALESRNWLSECLFIDCRWRNHGLTVELVFNDVWNEDRTAVRADADSRIRSFVIVADGVFEFHADHRITAGLLAEMDRANWGLDEIARVRIDKGVAHPVGGSPIATRVVKVSWESGRSVVVNAASLSALADL